MAIIIAISALLTFILIYLVYTNEKLKKDWIKTLQIGDTCRIAKNHNFHTTNYKIIKINKNNVSIEINIDKRWIYPPKK